MAEFLKSGERESSSQGSDWDALTELANKNMDGTPEEPVVGASKWFQAEAARHRARAEETMDGMSDAQLEGLRKAGIRDATDAGEFLHETALWAEQVEQQAGAIDKNIEIVNQLLEEEGYNNGVDPVTAERREDSPFGEISDPKMAEEWRKNFQEWQEDMIQMNRLETKAVAGMIADELQLKRAESEEPEPRSREALDAEAIDKWRAAILADEDRKKVLEDSTFYATLKRKLQREAEEQSEA